MQSPRAQRLVAVCLRTIDVSAAVSQTHSKAGCSVKQRKARGVITATQNGELQGSRIRTHIHATRTCIHSLAGLRHTGHSFIMAEHSPHAHW